MPWPPNAHWIPYELLAGLVLVAFGVWVLMGIAVSVGITKEISQHISGQLAEIAKQVSSVGEEVQRLQDD